MSDILSALRNGNWEDIWKGVMQLHYEFIQFAPEYLQGVMKEAVHCRTMDDLFAWEYKANQAVVKLAEDQLQAGVALEYPNVNEGRVACPLCRSLGQSVWPTLGYKVPRGLETHLENTCDFFRRIHDYALMHVWEAERQERLEAMRNAQAEREEQKRQRREPRKKERGESKKKPEVSH